MKKAVLIVTLLLCCSYSALAQARLGGTIHLVRPDSPFIDHQYVPPEYLSAEDLIFYTCIEEKNIPVKSTVICLDDNSFTDLSSVRWLDSQNCYMSSYDLSQKDCRRLLIMSEYMKDDELVTLRRNIKVNRLSSILDLVTQNQYSDGGWKDSVHTAAGIWVLSNYEQIYSHELALAVDWLKQYRNNDLKCWPKDDCSTLTTAKIMAYLTLSGLNDTSRIVHDGINFLQNEHNFYFEDDLWNLTVQPFEQGNTSCLLSYAGNVVNEQNFSIAFGSTRRLEIRPVPDEPLMVICDGNIRATLTASDADQVFLYEGDNMSYRIPYNCWSRDQKWGECDLLTTLFAMMTNISEDQKAAAHEYLRSQLQTTRSGDQYIGGINESALFIYTDPNPDVISYVRYRQNNNGSWGTGSSFENVIPTGYALLGLLASGFNRTNEVIEDAEVWVNERELEFTLNRTQDYQAWNSTEKNAFAFTVLKNNARPAVKSSPRIVLMDRDSIELELYNPTTFPLEQVSFRFSDNLKDIMEIEQKDLIPPYSYVKATLSKKAGDTGNIFGYLFIDNFDDELGKVPVMIVSYPHLEIKSAQESLLVFGTSGTAEFNVAKTGHSFDCTLEWDDSDISSQKEFTIAGNTLSVSISFSGPQRLERTYTGTFFCRSGDHEVESPFSIRISRYEAFPFSVEPEDILINQSGRDSYFVVSNLLDETIDVTARFLKLSEYFELSRESFAVDPNQKVNITVYNKAPGDANLSLTNAIEVTSLGQKRQVNLRAAIIAETPSRLSPVLLWSVIAIIAAVLSAGAFFGYRYRQAIMVFLRRGNKIDAIKIKIKKLEEREKNTAILNMVKILRILKKDDIQIRARLRQEGFTEPEIDAALSQEGGEEETDVDEGLFSSK